MCTVYVTVVCHKFQYFVTFSWHFLTLAMLNIFQTQEKKTYEVWSSAIVFLSCHSFKMVTITLDFIEVFRKKKMKKTKHTYVSAFVGVDGLYPQEFWLNNF